MNMQTIANLVRSTIFDKPRRSAGFTIIEVLIVLAIAGLIMVVVFLAVPALQRSQRNNTVRSDARALLAAYQEVSTNKGGRILTVGENSVAGSDAEKVYKAANTAQIKEFRIGRTNRPTYYARAQTNASNYPVVVTPSRAIIRQNSKCADPLLTAGYTDERTRGVAGATGQAALYFAVEAKNSLRVSLQCINT